MPVMPVGVSQGDCRGDALNNIREAIAACLEVGAERGLSVTIEIRRAEVAVLRVLWWDFPLPGTWGASA